MDDREIDRLRDLFPSWSITSDGNWLTAVKGGYHVSAETAAVLADAMRDFDSGACA